MKTFILSSAALALVSTADAQTAKLTAYPAAWDTSKVGAAEPSLNLKMAYRASWKTGDPTGVCTDGVAGCKLYAPIHSKLGTGAMAQPSNTAAISTPGPALVLKTINPSSSGAGGTDVNVQTMDSHGHGFSITNGYIEAVLALPTAHGSHAGFWLLNVQTPQGHGEIDFPETYGAADHVFASAVHWWPTAASRFQTEVHAGHYWSPTPTPYGELAHYGVWLTPTTICTYLNHKQVGCEARLPEMQGPFYALLSVFTDANRKDGYQPATMEVVSLTAWSK